MTSWLTLLVSSTIYMGLAIVATYEFGSSLQHSILDSVDEQEHMTSSYLIRFSYLLGLLLHIPFVFFSGKESVLIMIDETWNRTLSTEIQKKIELNDGEIGKNPSTVIDNMSDALYYSGTTFAILLCVVLAILIEDPS